MSDNIHNTGVIQIGDVVKFKGDKFNDLVVKRFYVIDILISQLDGSRALLLSHRDRHNDIVQPFIVSEVSFVRIESCQGGKDE